MEILIIICLIVVSWFSAKYISILAEKHLRYDLIILSFYAILIGILVSFVTIFFRFGISFLHTLLIRTPEYFSESYAILPWYIRLLIPSLGGLLVGILLIISIPEKRVHGVADLMEAISFRGGRMGIRDGFGSMLVSIASIGVASASTGRAGPILHMGATITHLTFAKLRLPRRYKLTMMGCGVAAAISSIFNAPLAGTFFAVEIFTGTYSIRAFIPLLLAAATGAFLTRSFFGDNPVFIQPGYEIVSNLEVLIFIALSILIGALSIALIKSIIIAEKMIKKIKMPITLRFTAGGLCLGMIGLFHPGLIGEGIGLIELVTAQQYSVSFLFILIGLKIIATAISIGSGFGGSVFYPSLVLGALAGGFYGSLIHYIFPSITSSPGAYSLYGMAGILASVIGAPVSSVLLAFEAVGSGGTIIPIMYVVPISWAITQATLGNDFFALQSKQRGKKQWDVFISHASEDIEQARELRNKLEHRNISCFLAPDDLTMEIGSDEWKDALDDVLRSTRTLIVLITDTSIHSRWVKHEWTFFHKQIQEEKDQDKSKLLITKGLIVPVCFEGPAPGELEEGLRIYQGIDCRNLKTRGNRISEVIDLVTDSLHSMKRQ